MAEEEKKETHADAEVSAKKASKEEKKKNVLHAPNKASGLDMDDHSRGQTLCEVNVTVPVPSGTSSRLVLCEVEKEHLKIGLKGQNPIIGEELLEPVYPGDSFWTLEDNKAISIFMAKSKDMWWKSLFKGGPEIDPLKAEQTSRPPHWDTESWLLVQKMMFIERRKLKLLGLPTSDEIMKRGILDNILALERNNPNIKLDSNKLLALMMQTLGVDVIES